MSSIGSMPLADGRFGKAKPCPCKTVGWVKKVEKDHIVLASSFYPDDKDEHGDFAFCQRAW